MFLKQVFMFLVVGLFVTGANSSELSSVKNNDKQIAMKLAIKDLELREKTAATRKLEVATLRLLKSAATFSRDNCDDDKPDSGTSSCWDKCSSEGWSSSYCDSLCGSDSSTGQESCWDKCSSEGWSSSYCNNLCGSSTDGGQEGCWEKCSAEGWSSSYCKNLCGT